MIDFTSRTSGASFVYTDDDSHKVTGSYVVDDGKNFVTLNASLYLNESYKGNSFLENGELKFTFQTVSVNDIPGLVTAMEDCMAEIKERM